eukprot:TRINITY_DN26322_c0_g1_i1.p1 TRINITY_DN26322_c0_g1~~TRINITY_DN26322_c0_g1_i1.p1  ORF type:complete len:151 (+),score=15.50 TRINITY_DN26322_c0_g1_i1:321-773(+)
MVDMPPVLVYASTAACTPLGPDNDASFSLPALCTVNLGVMDDIDLFCRMTTDFWCRTDPTDWKGLRSTSALEASLSSSSSSGLVTVTAGTWSTSPLPAFLVSPTWKWGMDTPVSYTHLRAHETPEHLVCRLLLEKKKKTKQVHNNSMLIK